MTMKRLLFLIILILMCAMPSGATYYVVGNSPMGDGFSPDKGKAMTEHPDGTYTLKCGGFSGYVRFVFADSLAEAGDWDSFSESMRIGPVDGLENIESGTWIPTQKASGDANSAYRFYGRSGKKYLITLDIINWRFRIDIDNSDNYDLSKTASVTISLMTMRWKLRTTGKDTIISGIIRAISVFPKPLPYMMTLIL